MPIFEYICRDCEHEFEAIVLGSQPARCPKCESKKLDQQLSRFAVQGKGSSEGLSDSRAADSGGCGACGNPDGPGACAMDDME